MELPPSEKHPLVCRHQAAACKPTFQFNSAHRPFQAAALVAANAIASCVSGLPHITSKSSDEEEKENFLARV